MDEPDSRRRDAERRLALSRSTAAAEAQRAQVLLDDFVAELTAAGSAAEPLQAILLNGRRVRTPLSGWYLNTARTAAVSVDGHFLNLVTPGGRLAWLTGVVPQPAQPGLEVGRGGRDGETGPLRDFLARAKEHYLAGEANAS